MGFATGVRRLCWDPMLPCPEGKEVFHLDPEKLREFGQRPHGRASIPAGLGISTNPRLNVGPFRPEQRVYLAYHRERLA